MAKTARCNSIDFFVAYATLKEVVINKVVNFYSENSGTLIRTLIYTVGHFFIAASCVMYFTGADFYAAITDAVVEPLLNGVWYFVLDKLWVKRELRLQKEAQLA